MERSTLKKIAFVWGAMLVCMLMMAIMSPPSLGSPVVPQSGGMPPQQMFGQVTQFFHDMQSNITPPKGIA